MLNEQMYIWAAGHTRLHTEIKKQNFKVRIDLPWDFKVRDDEKFKNLRKNTEEKYRLC